MWSISFLKVQVATKILKDSPDKLIFIVFFFLLGGTGIWT
jgi:hypothetical protein